MRHYSSIYDITHPYMILLIHMRHYSSICDITHPYATLLIQMWHYFQLVVRHIHATNKQSHATHKQKIHMWHDSSICDITHPYVTLLSTRRGTHSWHTPTKSRHASTSSARYEPVTYRPSWFVTQRRIVAWRVRAQQCARTIPGHHCRVTLRTLLSADCYSVHLVCCVFVCVCVCVWHMHSHMMYVCMYVYMHVCMYLCMHICIYIWTYVRVCVCAYLYMYVCVSANIPCIWGGYS